MPEEVTVAWLFDRACCAFSPGPSALHTGGPRGEVGFKHVSAATLIAKEPELSNRKKGGRKQRKNKLGHRKYHWNKQQKNTSGLWSE